MSVAPVTESGTKRRIGDILLELGFASEAALVKAAAEQEQTGQPLGQILVEHGVITRLELASALAEQWSDNTSITPLPVPSAMPRLIPQPHDEDEYAARLQEAVAVLSQRVDATRQDEGVDSRVTELAERIEATVARTQRLEATIATLAESFDGVTGGVEEAFAALQSGMSGLALDLARLDTTVAELRAEPAVEPVDTSRLERHVEDLRLAVEQLSERPLVDEEARRRATELAEAVENLADGAALESVRGALGSLERRVAEIGARDDAAAELDAQRALLGELQSAVADLRDRPTGDPELDARLGRIETQLAEVSSHATSAADVEALANRLKKTRDAQDDLGRSVEKLAARLDDLAKRTSGDVAPSAELEALRTCLAGLAEELAEVREAVPSTHVAELAERVELLAADDGQRLLERRLHELEARLDDGYVTRDGLAHALDRAREELRPEPVAPDPRVDELARDLDTLHQQLARVEQVEAHLGEGVVTPDELARNMDTLRDELARVEQLEARLGAGVVTPEELAAALDRTRQELRPAPPAPDPRIERLTQDLGALREDVARSSASPAEDAQARAELAALEDRVERLVSRDELARVVAESRATPPEAFAGEDPRVDRLVHDLDVLRSEVSRIEPAPVPDPEIGARLASLAERVDEIARGRQEADARGLELQSRLDAAVTQDELRVALERAREEIATHEPPEPDRRVELVATELEALRHDLGRAVSAPPAAVSEALERISARLDAVESAAPPQPVDTSELEAGIAGLATRLAGLEALPARVDQLAETVAAPVPVDHGPVDQLRTELDGRLAELARTLEERLASAAQAPTTAAKGIDDGIEDELERTRMAIERLSLHLGEHDRALVEMRGSRAMAQRLEELAARIEELANAPVPAQPLERTGAGPESAYARRSLEPDIEMRAVLRRVQDLEEAASVGREKLMNRLERMASSIDWRLQRLEATDQETP